MKASIQTRNIQHRTCIHPTLVITLSEVLDTDLERYRAATIEMNILKAIGNLHSLPVVSHEGKLTITMIHRPVASMLEDQKQVIQRVLAGYLLQEYRQMYTAMIFSDFLNAFYKSEGGTPEECLSKLQQQSKFSRLTYRPADGTIYHNAHDVPCGVVFKQHP